MGDNPQSSGTDTSCQWSDMHSWVQTHIRSLALGHTCKAILWSTWGIFCVSGIFTLNCGRSRKNDPDNECRNRPEALGTLSQHKTLSAFRELFQTPRNLLKHLQAPNTISPVLTLQGSLKTNVAKRFLTFTRRAPALNTSEITYVLHYKRFETLRVRIEQDFTWMFLQISRLQLRSSFGWKADSRSLASVRFPQVRKTQR